MKCRVFIENLFNKINGGSSAGQSVPIKNREGRPERSGLSLLY